jgi:hypothetical protein
VYVIRIRQSDRHDEAERTAGATQGPQRRHRVVEFGQPGLAIGSRS